MELYEKNGNILYILNILKKYSDEGHMLKITDIQEKILDVYGIKIDPRTIRRNIALLKEKFRYDISTYSENKEGYYISKDPYTDFELGEIRLIIDQFSYSNYIPQNMSGSIISKCMNMCNIYENEKIKNYSIVLKDTKTENLEIIKNIEDISEAIYNKKKIKFNYFKYDLSPTLKKINKAAIICTPYKIVYQLQQIYLIALKDGAEDFYTYRIDRMKDITIMENSLYKNMPASMINDYIKSNVAMFSGKPQDIEFKCNINLLDMVVEQFGKDITMQKIDDNTFYAKVTSNLEGFKFFALRNLENVKVLKPLKLKIDIDKILKNYLK